ncbi:hypothetical protein ACFLW2_00145 [Chloroflexota bacterium]
MTSTYVISDSHPRYARRLSPIVQDSSILPHGEDIGGGATPDIPECFRCTAALPIPPLSVQKDVANYP